jgi:MFS transporter, ACS family, allantoate permease
LYANTETVIVIFCTVTSATYWKNGRAWSGILAYAVAILGSILVNALPDHRVGLLFSYWISGASPFSLSADPELSFFLCGVVTSIAPFVVILAWSAAVTAGHTKRTTMNAVIMIGYAVGNAAGPQYWKKSYQPRCVLFLPNNSHPGWRC